jgi:hypothetical protein
MEASTDILAPDDGRQFLSLLWSDIHACKVGDDTDGTGTEKRQFLRAMFACIEGAVWLFKQASLEQHRNGSITFNPAELQLLAETIAGLDNQGGAQEYPASLRFLPNLRFAFDCHCRAFDYEPVLNVGDHEWDSLRRTVEVRNRLMHPKQLDDLGVSNEELRLARDALKWFGLACSVATLGVSMWYAKRSLDTIEDQDDRAARWQTISASSDKLRRVVLDL